MRTLDLREVRYEAPLTQFLFEKASRQKIPLSGTFELSPVCNFSCRMCYVRKTAAEVAASPRPIMTLDRWLELARQARDAGMLYLLLTGGEPFLWPDFWPLYEQLHGMGFVISINTNGSLIDDAAVARLAKMPPSRINITLYGASDDTYYRLCGVHGAFDRVDHAITALRQAGILVKLNGSLTPQNAGDLPAMVRYGDSHGLIYEANAYMFPPLRRDPSMVGRNDRFTPRQAAQCHMRRYRLQYGEETYQKYLRDVVQGLAAPPGLEESCVDPRDGTIRCRAGKAAFWITWDGWMTPCGMMPQPRVDLTGRSFAQAWQQVVEQCAALRLSGVCTTCPNRQMCHSCAAMAMAETGTADGIPKYLCEMTLAMKDLARAELAGQADPPVTSKSCK